MNKWGTVLTGRRLGKDVRKALLNQIGSNIIVIDFNGVRVASHSFCDEAFGKMVFEVEEPKSKIKFINTDDATKIVIKHVMSERLREKQLNLV